MKRWKIGKRITESRKHKSEEEIITLLFKERGLKNRKDIDEFLNPKKPEKLTIKDVGIEPKKMSACVSRILKAIKNKESIVVYADYDADGICAGAILWEALWKMGAQVMPYIPHRENEGYGLSEKGIDAVVKQYDPKLIITVDHGISARDKVAYAQKQGIDMIVTDHHTKPTALPDCTIVHTTQLSGSGVSWFVAQEVTGGASVELAAIGTIADLLPLTDANRSIVAHGLQAMHTTRRIGLRALMKEAGSVNVDTYAVSHQLAPRLNAMGRIDHALDALRLLCTTSEEKAKLLAEKLGLTNRERQKLTEETVTHARSLIPQNSLKSLIFLSHESYNQGIIGLVAGRLAEEYYRPVIVLSKGETYAKASARSIPGFNIIEAIRYCSDLLVDAGGHPMAAGFTVETKNISRLHAKLTGLADKQITQDMLQKTLAIDVEMPLEYATEKLWQHIQQLAPFGIGNHQPVFATRRVLVADVRLIGKDRNHLKLRISSPNSPSSLKPLIIDAVAFNLGYLYGQLAQGTTVDLAYTLDTNEWNGRRSLQLKIRDVKQR